MMSFRVVMRHVLPNDGPEMPLSQRDDVIETLTPNGSDEALRKGVEIRTAGG
jgi:hypothetical protein